MPTHSGVMIVPGEDDGAMLIFPIMAAAAAQDVSARDDAAPSIMGPVLPVAPPAERPASLDVAKQALECRQQDAGEIVVCADREGADRYRLSPLPEEETAATPPRAETVLFGKVKASADLDSETLQQGSVSKRLMLRFTLPF